MKVQKTNNRGAHRTKDCVFVGAWLPLTLVNALDDAVRSQDSDRSKLIREALREKIQTMEVA